MSDPWGEAEEEEKGSHPEERPRPDLPTPVIDHCQDITSDDANGGPTEMTLEIGVTKRDLFSAEERDET